MSEQAPEKVIYLATRNAHKVEELNALLQPLGWRVRSCVDVAPDVRWAETGTTFVENARIKAVALRAKIEGYILADDSGLEIDILNGEPGVQSACYAGVDGDHKANNEKLVSELKKRNADESPARFRCTLLLLTPSESEHIFEGVLEGTIRKEHSGLQGFGYDPHFVPHKTDRALAQMSADEKNAISHRGLAVAKLLEFLRSLEG